MTHEHSQFLIANPKLRPTHSDSLKLIKSKTREHLNFDPMYTLLKISSGLSISQNTECTDCISQITYAHHLPTQPLSLGVLLFICIGCSISATTCREPWRWQTDHSWLYTSSMYDFVWTHHVIIFVIQNMAMPHIARTNCRVKREGPTISSQKANSITGDLAREHNRGVFLSSLKYEWILSWTCETTSWFSIANCNITIATIEPA